MCWETRGCVNSDSVDCICGAGKRDHTNSLHDKTGALNVGLTEGVNICLQPFTVSKSHAALRNTFYTLSFPPDSVHTRDMNMMV